MPDHNLIYGIDISWHNGLINWEEVREHRIVNENIGFVIIKATEGTDFRDSQFEYNWANSKANNFCRGAYHFFTTYSDPILQAENYLEVVKHEPGDFVPVLDFENDGRTKYERENLSKNARIWLEKVEEAVGKKPIIYTNHLVYNKYIKNKIEGYDIWLADYSVFDPLIYSIENMIMWQHTDKGRIAGISKNVDLNLFFGTPHKFEKYIFD